MARGARGEVIVNFRDAGGLPTAEGREVRRGLLFRSSDPARASVHARSALSSLGIKTICDLRTDREARRNPHPHEGFVGCRYHHLPMKSRRHDDSGLFLQLLSLIAGRARRYRFEEVMEEVYREYVTDFRPQLSSVVRLAAHASNLPLLVHCTAGKDRTGLAIAIILTALGVRRESVVADYLASNAHLASVRVQVHRRLGRLALFGLDPERVMPLLEARRSYLDAAFREMEETFGGFEAYLHEGLGISSAERGRLQRLFLVESSGGSGPRTGSLTRTDAPLAWSQDMPPAT